MITQAKYQGQGSIGLKARVKKTDQHDRSHFLPAKRGQQTRVHVIVLTAGGRICKIGEYLAKLQAGKG